MIRMTIKMMIKIMTILKMVPVLRELKIYCGKYSESPCSHGLTLRHLQPNEFLSYRTVGSLGVHRTLYSSLGLHCLVF